MIRVLLMLRGASYTAWLAIASVQAVAAQEISVEEVKNAVVMVEVWTPPVVPGGLSDSGGAGLIMGWDDRTFTIATAAHVIKAVDQGKVLRVHFAWDPNTSSPANVVWRGDIEAGEDLAFLSVPLSPTGTAQVPRRILGSSKADLFPADEVHTLGQPGLKPWYTNPLADEVFRVREATSGLETLKINSDFVDKGTSGGGLFNERWQLIGMVLRTEPNEARVLPIERVVERLRAEGLPLVLGRAPTLTAAEREERAFALFRYSLSRLKEGDACVAHAGFTRAIELRPAAGGMVRLGGTRYTPYLPYWHRGRSLVALDQCFEARRDWRVAVEQGAVLETKHMRRLEAADGACRSQLARLPAVAQPASTGPANADAAPATRLIRTPQECSAELNSEVACRRCRGL